MLLNYNSTFPYLGFILCRIPLRFFLFKANELQKWFVGLAGALIASLSSDVLCDRWLEHLASRGNCRKTAFLTPSTETKKGSLNGFVWDPVLRFFCRSNPREPHLFYYQRLICTLIGVLPVIGPVGAISVFPSPCAAFFP
jgi:hypothetical protein